MANPPTPPHRAASACTNLFPGCGKQALIRPGRPPAKPNGHRQLAAAAAGGCQGRQTRPGIPGRPLGAAGLGDAAAVQADEARWHQWLAPLTGCLAAGHDRLRHKIGHHRCRARPRCLAALPGIQGPCSQLDEAKVQKLDRVLPGWKTGRQLGRNPHQQRTRHISRGRRYQQQESEGTAMCPGGEQ
jgi:hypothetical protein